MNVLYLIKMQDLVRRLDVLYIRECFMLNQADSLVRRLDALNTCDIFAVFFCNFQRLFCFGCYSMLLFLV